MREEVEVEVERESSPWLDAFLYLRPSFPYLRHAKRSRCPRQRPHVVLLRHVVNDEEAGGPARGQRRRSGRQERKRRSRASIDGGGEVALFFFFFFFVLGTVDGVRHDDSGGRSSSSSSNNSSSFSCFSQDHGKGLRRAELSAGARRADGGEEVFVVGRSSGSGG